MYEDYDLFKFSADLQEVLYENERLKLENEELKKQLKMFEGHLREDLVVQQETSFDWVKYFLRDSN